MGASSSGCNGFFTVTLIISFIFASAWTAIAIIGFLLLNCSMDLDVQNKAYILKLIYFYNENCLPEWWEKIPGLTDVFKTTSRTEAVLWWYAVSGALRALAAVGAMVAMAMCCFGKKPHAVATPRPSPLAWVWVAVSLAGLIGDLVCSVLYGLDIGHAQDLNTLTGIPWDIPEQFKGALWAIKLCPIVMMLFCSRFCAFWILDACLLIMAVLSLARQQKEAKIYGSSTPGDDLEPWKSKFTKAAGVDKGEKSNKNGANNGNVEHMDRWLNNNQNMFARSVSEYYAEPLTNGGGQPGRGNQDTTDHGAYMSSPIIDPRSYPQTPSAIYTQPWSHVRPPQPQDGGHSPRVDAPGHNPRLDAPGHSPRVDAPSHNPRLDAPGHSPYMNGPGPSPSRLDPHWQPQLDQRAGRDPRSPWPHPASEQAFFPNAGYGKPFPSQQPSPSQERPMPSQGAHRTSNGGAPADKEQPRRYVEKLRDVEEERLALKEARDAERRRREEERAEEERQHSESVKQEMIAKAQAMEKSRRLRREAAGEEDGETKKEKGGRMRGPPPPVPARPRRPEELKNQTPWSYVGPALAHPKDLPMQNRAGRDDDDSDEDEEKPTVPVPDYTLHIKRPNDRPTIDTN